MSVWAVSHYYDIPFCGITVESVGIIWFLYALFVGRAIYEYIRWKFDGTKLVCISLVISMFGIICGGYIEMPLALDVAMSANAFFLIGDKAKSFNGSWKQIRLFVLSATVWLCLFCLYYYVFPTEKAYGLLNMADRSYPLFMVSYTAAIFGTFVIVYICKSFETTFIGKVMAFIGEFSLYLLLIHSVDRVVAPLWQTDTDVFKFVLRVCVDLSIFLSYCFFFNRKAKEQLQYLYLKK
ncbi:MAG: hypothetical protein NC344_04195 [Bacteroidales bacterium]|nr:hypothetical protein [Bacteroidales bacterium]MCM1147029.1 hypothetical protein [Bacteroidales bacterium]MCM1205838.1 hypothetical protein [Bacillota bacterium]MCM1509920.1 hypothetical protein [Clostridium sp.]